MTEEKEGWVYCISNPEMPTLLKIGMTDRTPQERLAEANRSDTWRPPVDFKIEFAKKVKNALKKEKTIHKLLEQYNERVNRSREFFRISTEKARLYFELMDGEWWESTEHSNDDDKPDPKPKTKKQTGGEAIPKKPKASSKKPVKINSLLVENLTKKESHLLLTTAIAKKAVEISLCNSYYIYGDIERGLLDNKLETAMIFSALCNSADDCSRVVSSSNIDIIIKKLNDSAPSTFILLKQNCENVVVEPETEPVVDTIVFDKNLEDKDKKKVEYILNANIKDLSFEESKSLLFNAFTQEALCFKFGRRFYRFSELWKLIPSQIKNSVFEAKLVQAPDGYSSVDEDYALFVSKSNYKSIIETLKDKTTKHIIILTAICKL